jgi:hypothetical protein
MLPMPLITTLIPAYKPKYLGDALLGLSRQSVQDFQVILSDDSDDLQITRLIEAGHYGDLPARLGLRCVAGPRHPRLNQRALIDLWAASTPFVHLHLDDDMVYPDFYAAHLQAHAAGRFSASVSRRWASAEDTRPSQSFAVPRFVAESPASHVAIDEAALFSSMLPACANWMGEFSNMLISAEGAARWPRPPTVAPNYYGWPDVGFLFEAVQARPIVFIKEHLGIFRQHPAQTTHRMHNHGGRVSALSWGTYALLAWHQGRLDAAQAVQGWTTNLRRCMDLYGDQDPVINRVYDITQHQGTSLEHLYTAYMPFWLDLLASDRSTCPAVQDEPVEA